MLCMDYVHSSLSIPMGIEKHGSDSEEFLSYILFVALIC